MGYTALEILQIKRIVHDMTASIGPIEFHRTSRLFSPRKPVDAGVPETRSVFDVKRIGSRTAKYQPDTTTDQSSIRSVTMSEFLSFMRVRQRRRGKEMHPICRGTSGCRSKNKLGVK